MGKKESTSPAQDTEWSGLLPLEVAEKFRQADTTAERLKWVRDPFARG